MIHLTEELIDKIEAVRNISFPDYISVKYSNGKIYFKFNGTYWGIVIDDEGEKVGLYFYGSFKGEVVDKAIAYIKNWTGAGK